MSALLEVDGLHVRFKAMGPIKARLVRHREPLPRCRPRRFFAVQAGSTFALVGESGSGKSTLGRAIIGLVPVHAGTVTFEDARPLDRGGGGLAAIAGTWP